MSSFLILTHVFLRTKLISDYPCSSMSSSNKFAMASHFGSDHKYHTAFVIAVRIQILSVALN